MSAYVRQERVIGSGGRPRTVWTGCPFGCWHGSRVQAVRCCDRHERAAVERAARDEERGSAA